MKGPTEDFWAMAGVALVIFALCLGVGSCVALTGLSAPAEPKTEGQGRTDRSPSPGMNKDPIE